MIWFFLPNFSSCCFGLLGYTLAHCRETSIPHDPKLVPLQRREPRHWLRTSSTAAPAPLTVTCGLPGEEKQKKDSGLSELNNHLFHRSCLIWLISWDSRLIYISVPTVWGMLPCGPCTLCCSADVHLPTNVAATQTETPGIYPPVRWAFFFGEPCKAAGSPIYRV